MIIKRIKLLAGVILTLTFLFAFHTEVQTSQVVMQEDQLNCLSSHIVNEGGISGKSIRAVKSVMEDEKNTTNAISSKKVNSTNLAKYSGSYGYSTLSTEGKKAYNALKKIGYSFHNSGKNAGKVTYSDGSYGYVTTAINISSYNVYIKDLSKIFFAFEADNPMLYWIDGVSYGTSGSKVTQLYLTVDTSYTSGATRTKVQNAIDKGLKAYTKQIDTLKAKGSSNMFIELVVHDLIIDKCAYAFDGNGKPHEAAWAHNIYGIFGKGKAVCQGYAKAFQLLMNYAGMESIYAIGYGLGDGHAWNLVRHNGTWYGVDVTWDDVGDHASKLGTGVLYQYFNSSTKMFNKTHTYDYTYFDEMYKVPAASSTDTYWYYSYYKLKHSLITTPTAESVTTVFQSALASAEKTSQYMLQIAVRQGTEKAFNEVLTRSKGDIVKALSSNGTLYEIGTPVQGAYDDDNNEFYPWVFVYVPVSVKTIDNIRANGIYFDNYQFKVYNRDSSGKKDVTAQVAAAVRDGKLEVSYNGAMIGSYSVSIKKPQVEPIAPLSYTGGEQKPKPQVTLDGGILVEGVDYTLSYKNNVNAGTGYVILTGIGKYMGTKRIPFTIQPFNLQNSIIAKVGTKTYTGSKITPSLIMVNSAGAIIENNNYSIVYKNNVNVGVATVTVSGMNNYTGTLTTTFNIAKRKISTCTVDKISNQSYTGKFITPKLSIKSGSKVLVRNKDYRVKYTSNVRPGKAKIVITGMGANLTGTKTIYFNIVPKKVTTIKASSNSRRVVVKWGKSAYASGYTVFYSNSKNGTYKSWGNTTKTALTKTKLTRGKALYIQVRPYKLMGGKKYYGSTGKIIRIVVK